LKDYNYVYKALRESHEVYARPRVVAEFNHNLASKPTATNIQAVANDSDIEPDLFPIESIVEGVRPTRGIVKALLGAVNSVPEYEAAPNAVRYYPVDPDDKYKYWISPVPTSSNNFPAWNSNGYTTEVNPTVTYSQKVKTNKIVIGLENSVASPTAYDVYVQAVAGGTWTKVATNPTINAQGQIILYYNGSAWAGTKNLDYHTELTGVQLRVKSMSKATIYFSLIEMALKLEKDLTPYVTEISDTFDIGELDVARPIGRISSNVGSVNLFNEKTDDGEGFLFNIRNPNSVFYNLLDENVKFTVDYLYDTRNVGGPSEVAIRQLTMWTEGIWTAAGEESISVSLRDSSKFLQEAECPPLFYENLPVSGIVYRLLDLVGNNNYRIGVNGKYYNGTAWVDIVKDSVEDILPAYWISDKTTVWDALSELAEATQTAIYIDEYDRVNVLPTDQAFLNLSSGYMWDLRGTRSGVNLPDIAELSVEQQDPFNQVTVSYQPTKFDDLTPGVRANVIAWQPDGEAVNVRASDLQESITSNSTYIRLTPAVAATWPYAGKMRIDAEVIEYDAREYVWHTNASGSGNYVWITSQEEYEKYRDKTPPLYQYRNRWDGAFRIKQRGAENTKKTDHKVADMSGWTQKNVKGNRSYSDLNGFFKSSSQKPKPPTKPKAPKKNASKSAKKAYKDAVAKYNAAMADYKRRLNNWNNTRKIAFTDGIYETSDKGVLEFKTDSRFTADHWLMTLRGAADDASMQHYGTSIYFPASASHATQAAGIAVQLGDSNAESGYYIEIAPTAKVDKNKQVRRSLGVYTKKTDGKAYGLVTREPVVLENKWHALDVIVHRGEDVDNISVYLNGQFIMTVLRSGSNRMGGSGRFGIFTRGSTWSKFEYVYGIGARPASDNYPDEWSAWDRFAPDGNGNFGAFGSAFFTKYYAANWKTYKRKVKGKWVKEEARYNQFYFDEFGPIAREIRDYKVKFENELPIRMPFIMSSNEAGVSVTDFKPTPFGASFSVENTARTNQTVHGGDGINHVLYIYGQQLTQAEAKEVVSKDEDSIREIGKRDLSIESRLIQTESMAKRISDFVSKHWKNARDSYRVTVFGTPLIQVGDIVRVDFPAASLSLTAGRYYVASTSSTFSDGGLSTELVIVKLS